MSSWQFAQALDRAERYRNDPLWPQQSWRDPAAQVVTASGDGHLAIDQQKLVRGAAEGPYQADRHFLLGLLDGAPLFVTRDDTATMSLKDALGVLSAQELEIGFAASGLVGWHSRAGYCGRCGGDTSVAQAGNARVCGSCGAEDYPRTDPAVIVAVLNSDGHLLLGRQPSWPTSRYSVLAGFVEVGESLEQTVCREIDEEVGLQVGALRYLGSQPWPFPRSLMVAFSAVALSGTITPAPGEIEVARWFSREELASALADGSVSLPSEASISYRMIQAWMNGALNASQVG